MRKPGSKNCGSRSGCLRRKLGGVTNGQERLHGYKRRNLLTTKQSQQYSVKTPPQFVLA
jgi:hypothetical protein